MILTNKCLKKGKFLQLSREMAISIDVGLFFAPLAHTDTTLTYTCICLVTTLA
jgi:hypothetical protein